MQQFIIKHSVKVFGIFIFMLTCVSLQAQEKIEIDTQDVGSWFERNWMWVTAGVVLLLLIIIFSRSGGRRKTTTVIKDAHGKTKSVTTTEEQI